RITEQIRWRTTNFYTLEYARIGSQDFRKTDDRIQLESILSWNVPWQIDPYVGFSTVTQLLPGYNYTKNNTTVRSSGIFDPGYVNQSVGFVHYLNSILVSRMGFAVRETFARQYARHILPDSLKSYDIQYGLQIVSDYDQTFGNWLEISSQVNIFSSLVSFKTTDVQWINYIAFRFLNYLTLQVQWTLIYDINQSPRRQLRDIMTFGFHYTVF
ncbi:MAG: DUF3078 domain-containing protein, partial [Calditrichota bacterium]